MPASLARRAAAGVAIGALSLGLLALGASAAPAARPASAPRAAPAAKPAEPAKDEDCLACHADRDLKRDRPRPGRAASLHVDAAAVEGSTHAGLGCVGCHTTATAPHEARLPAVRCTECHDEVPAVLAGGAHGPRPAGAKEAAPTCAGCHGSHAVQPAATLGVEACAGCHQRQVDLYRASIHGRAQRSGVTEAATCASCHGTAHAALRHTDPRAATYHLNLPRTCAQCHADPDLARRRNIPVANVYQLYMDSIHGRAMTRSGLLVSANCSDCHGTHDIQPRGEPSSRVFRANIARTCGGCHAGVQAAYAQSIHGQKAVAGDSSAPVCTDCHSAHQIRRVEAASAQLQAIQECGTCHDESLKTYRDTFHGKVTALGFTRVAKCADCHTAHAVLPATDQRSSVSATNIVATCRPCHPQASWQFAQFHPHADPSDRARFPRLYYTWVFMTGLLAATFVFFGLHTLLWLPRSLVERLRRRGRARHEREEPGR